MKTTNIIVIAAIAMTAASPAFAGLFGGAGGRTGANSPGRGPSSAPAPAPAASTPSGSTSVPEPSDAVLVLMGAAGVVIGRRLHKRAKKG